MWALILEKEIWPKSTCLTWLMRSSALITLIKNLGRHTTHVSPYPWEGRPHRAAEAHEGGHEELEKQGIISSSCKENGLNFFTYSSSRAAVFKNFHEKKRSNLCISNAVVWLQVYKPQGTCKASSTRWAKLGRPLIRMISQPWAVSWVQLQMPSGCRIHAFSKVSFSSSILNCFPFTADGLLHSLLYLYMSFTCFDLCVQQFSSSPKERSEELGWLQRLHGLIVTTGIRVVLWSVGPLDLYLNFYILMKYSWTFYLPVTHAFSAGMNLKYI
jgi:hypothetical protein